jgi:hypothetical protein
MAPLPHTYNIDTKEKQRDFLEAVRDHLTLAGAARVAGLQPSSVYRWRREDPQFDEAFKAAQEEALDHLETSLYQRAIEKSDVAAAMLLNARRSELYRYTKRLEVTGAGGGPIAYTVRWQLPEEALPVPAQEDVLEGELLSTDDTTPTPISADPTADADVVRMLGESVS